ncbi:PhnD/SsuA/transferrin family substrate-binding protein [Sphingomonas sp. YL-JM2C]
MLKAIWFAPPVVHRVAGRDGLLDRADVSVDGVLTTSSDEQFDGLVEGRHDFAVTAMDNVIMWNRRPGGGALRIFAQIEASTNIVLIARPPFADMASLAGRKLLVDSPTNGFVVPLRAMLADAGVSFDACEIVESGGVKERLDRLLAGEGDATLLGPPFSDIARAAGMIQLAEADQAFPGYPGQGVVASTRLDRRKRDELSRWLGAIEAARQAARANVADVARLLESQGVPAAAAAALARAVGPNLVPDRRGVDMIIDQRVRLGLPGSDCGYDDLVDLSLLAAAPDHPDMTASPKGTLE